MVFRYIRSRHPARQLRREMDRLFSGVLGNVGRHGWPFAGRGQLPVNVWESAEAIYAELELPGVQSNRVEISVVGDELTVKVQRPDVEEEGVTYHRRERSVGAFTRVLRLPVDVDADRVEAELRQGVLTVTLPKAEAVRPRKIRITSSR